jgi:molybdenum cofactor synthesis domain-containing protein
VASLLRVDQRRVLKLVTPKVAFHSLKKALHIAKLDSEPVSIKNACGRVLAENIVASFDIPSIKRSAVDGYAVKSKNTKNATPEKPLKLKIIGELFPTSILGELNLQHGHTVYLACGAPVPEGADAVIRVEEARRRGEELEVCHPIGKNKNVIMAGEDVKRGSIVLREGHVLRPQDIGLLVALNIRSVMVIRKPRVAIISVGDELTTMEKDEPSKIVNNYAFIISAMAEEFGALPAIMGIAPDVVSKISEKIDEALRAADIIVTIGGCSVGVKDFVPDAVNTIEKSRVIAHGIKISPGKVTGIAVVKGKPMVMLPGHIVSCVAGFHLFVVPLIRLYSGHSVPHAPEIRAKMSKNVKGKRGMQTFIPVHLKKVKGGFVAKPIYGESSSLRTLIRANGFTILNEGAVIEKGEEVAVTLFSEKELLKL